jgi:hypothetical protein
MRRYVWLVAAAIIAGACAGAADETTTSTSNPASTSLESTTTAVLPGSTTSVETTTSTVQQATTSQPTRTSTTESVTTTVEPTSVEVLDVSDWIGRDVSRFDGDDWWDSVLVDGEQQDLSVLEEVFAPWNDDYSAAGSVWLVTDEPEAYLDRGVASHLMVWVFDGSSPVADALGLRLPPGMRLEYCWQSNRQGAAWPLVLWVDDLAWAVQPLPDYITPFDKEATECSAG